jgi:uncharacterized protein (TIRG00374 family)
MFIPSAGLSGLALRARYFGEAGCSVEAVLLTYVVETLGQGMAITIMVALALLWLTVAGQGAPWWILALLLGTILAGSTFLAILVSRPHEADWRLALLDRVIKMLPQQGRRPLQALALEERLGNLRQAVLALSTPLRLRLLLASIGRVLADILCLQMTLLAFGQAVLLGLTIIGYGLSAVLSYLSSLPGGLFVTEGSLSAILAKQGVPLALAVAAILTYRLFAFWLPRVLGLGTWWNLQRHSDRPLW